MAPAAQNRGSSGPGGLSSSLKGLAVTLLAIAHTRLELFSVELEEEWVRVSSILRWTLAGLFFAGLALVLATLFLIFALWEKNRLLALGVPAVLFVLGAALSWRVAVGKVKAKPRPFAASLSELDKDHQRLTSGS